MAELHIQNDKKLMQSLTAHAAARRLLQSMLIQVSVALPNNTSSIDLRS
jgi:hypothetical protein